MAAARARRLDRETGMSEERWRRVEDLFHRAADLSPAERDALLASACAGDDGLRKEVESLLAADGDPDDVLEKAVSDAASRLREDAENESIRVGDRIGPYSIVALIGNGGMGAVYRALRDDEFRMEVALKLLKRGTDTESALRRFRKERQILAGLRHPNIAHLLDGGATEDGLPYFAMEYVEGRPLLDYAASLPIRQRLELFRSICAAVRYAHQNLVVHRDLKPGNILVTADGSPKLLDFGIAKLVDPEATGDEMMMTVAGTRVLTPDYASPEQVRGEPITIASDIYSLGVILYELLTGKRPHVIEAYTPQEIERAICREEPKKPSAWNAQVAADLDNIVLMALRKEPQRRYGSVEQFSEDVGRHLENRPIRARKDTLVYRTDKFIRRNKLGLLAAGIALTGLALGVAAVQHQVVWLGRPSTNRPPKSEARLMLAVLPFENLTGDPKEDYFSDGLTEEIITQVGNLDPDRLGVIARTSVMHYRNGTVPLDQVGRELGVRYIVEGSVRRDTNRVRISAQLVQTGDQTHIWARQYDRELRSLLTVQDEIAQEIAGEIRLTLDRTRSVVPRPNLSSRALEAYDLCLKGQYFFNKRTIDSLQEAAKDFQEAAVKDPNDARAEVGLADCFALMGGYGNLPQTEFGPKARAAANRAIQIDGRMAEAHAALALIVQNYDWDWQMAEKEFRRAIELNPNYATAHHWYAEHLMWRGRFDEALRESERARELDPLSLIVAADNGAILYYSRQYDRAIEKWKSVLDMDPDFLRAHLIRAAYVEKGMFAEALADTERMRSLTPVPSYWSWLACIDGRAGRMSEARRSLRKLLKWNRSHSADPVMTASAYLGAGDKDQALAWLERAYAQHSNELTALKVSPGFDSLRRDARFQDLLHRVGFRN